MAKSDLDEEMKFQPRIDNQLWADFVDADEREEYCRYWLTLQCSILTNVVQGIVILAGEEENTYSPSAKWPENGENPENLTEISERVLEDKCGMLVELGNAKSDPDELTRNYGIAYPIMAGDEFYGLVALEVTAEAEDQLKYTMEQLQWGTSWIEVMLRREKENKAKNSFERLKASVDLLADVLSKKSYISACMSLVTGLATSFECDRVSLGIKKNKKIRVEAVSHSSRVSESMNLTQAIIKAMEEAIAQRKEVYYPPSIYDRQIVRDHEALAKQYGLEHILSVPFYDEDKYLGIITLERSKGLAFSNDDAMYCNSVASLILPVLEIMRQKERSLPRFVLDGCENQLKKLFGPEYTGRKLLILFFIILITFFSLKEGDYKISANTVLEGAVKRVIVSPFEGYIKDAFFRAGDYVEQDEKLCMMDDRELRLERLNWVSKIAQYQKQYQEAQAKHKRAETKIIKAQLDQAAARLELTESQLKRTVITAPFKGLVLSGDLSQRLGGAASKGEILFEIAPLDRYRIILEVDERRITDLSVGQQGVMIISALPDDKIDFTVEKITPITMAKEGLNYFRVEAVPSVVVDRLRPGMEGVGKIYVDRRNLFSIWTRNMREWFKLKAWEYLP